MSELLSVIIPLFTFIAGAFLGHHFALGRDRRKEFFEAAAKFRNAFNKAQQRIESGEQSIYVIKDEFLSHDDAKHAFIHYLGSKKRLEFENDWAEYKRYNDEEVNRSDAFKFYPPEGETEFLRKSGINASEEYINKLLEYAPPK